MAEKANIIVEYANSWFQDNWYIAAIWCCVNMKKGCAIEPEFARFQTQEDADKFKRCIIDVAQ